MILKVLRENNVNLVNEEVANIKGKKYFYLAERL